MPRRKTWLVGIILCILSIVISAQDDLPTFEYSVIDDAFRHAQMIQAVDMDGDGDDDVILASSLNDAIYLYLNDSTGEAWEKINVAPENTIVAMQTTIGDFDADGDLDIAGVGLFDRDVCVFCSAGMVAWYENMGDLTTWETHILSDDLWGAFYIESGDINGDDLIDLVVSSISLDGNPSGLYYAMNTGTGFDSIDILDTEISATEALLLYDIDGDTVNDIIAVNTNASEVAWYRYADGDFMRYPIAMLPNPKDADFINLDDDPEPELLVTSDAGLWVFNMPDDPTNLWEGTSIDDTFYVGYGGIGRLTVADLTDDGLADIAVVVNSSEIGYSGIYWYANQGDGTFSIIDLSNDYVGITDVISADLDGDGRNDLLTATYNHTDSNDEIGWWRNTP